MDLAAEVQSERREETEEREEDDAGAVGDSVVARAVHEEEGRDAQAQKRRLAITPVRCRRWLRGNK